MRRPIPAPVRRGAGVLLGALPSRRLLRHSKSLRGAGLTFLWHRVRPDGPAPHDVVLTVRAELFRQQLEALGELGDIVSLADLDRPDPSARPRFALTFDDDDYGHARYTLPILREFGVPATFFLSGRWIHHLGPYWWEVLEEQIAARGLTETTRRLGVRAASVGELAARIEGSPAASRLGDLGDRANRTDRTSMMTSDHAEQLRQAGMEIGFHTVDHPVLPLLDVGALQDAVSRGRAELETALDASIVRFAYPHGRHDARVRTAACRAGYASAWTTSELVARAEDDPFSRGRWEPGSRDPDALVAGTLRRLLARSARP